LIAYYKLEKKSQKIVFRYEIDANIEVLVANRKIKRLESLNETDFETKNIKFNHFFSLPVYELDGLIAKQNISEGKILTKKLVKKKPLVFKGDILKAILIDGLLEVEIDAVALQNGNLGDIIRVRNQKGKVFRGKIISKESVLIR
jgi:flagella basal body P-ring formation protein FlgA